MAKKKAAKKRVSVVPRRVSRRRVRRFADTPKPTGEARSVLSLASEVISEHEGLLRRLADR